LNELDQRNLEPSRVPEAKPGGPGWVGTLTVIASLVLVPTLIVGYYGQNFAGSFDDWHWSLTFSMSLIVTTTLAQLAVYRWRGWI